MDNLRNASLLEAMVVNDYELRTYAGAVMKKRFGPSAPGEIMEAWREGTRLPGFLHGEEECRSAWKRMKMKPNMSVAAIMDFYRNGPEYLLGHIKNQMIQAYREYIYSLMKHYFTSFFQGYSEDLFDCGVIGLLYAMKDYNGKNAFTTYSQFFIVHEMAAFVYYLQGNPTCYYAKLQKQIKKIMMDNPDRQVSAKEISKKTGIRQDIVIRELEMMHATEFVYLDKNPVYRDTIVDGGKNVEEEVEGKVLKEALWKALRTLETEEVELLLMHFWKNYSFGRIAKEKGICYSKVKKQYDDVINKLRREIL